MLQGSRAIKNAARNSTHTETSTVKLYRYPYPTSVLKCTTNIIKVSDIDIVRWAYIINYHLKTQMEVLGERRLELCGRSIITRG